jgi:phosphoribosylformylglycinamidine cyclo-ligase
LTLARHVLLAPVYRERFPESAAPDLDAALSYRGRYLLADRPERLAGTIAEALLSPTRTYAPVVVKLLSELRPGVHGIVHCTGGGQTKCLRLGPAIRYIKDGLFEVPAIFGLIRDSADLPWAEMYQVFNMGHRMELYVDAGAAGEVIDVARSMGVDARQVGRCEPWGSGPRLVIEGPGASLEY